MTFLTLLSVYLLGGLTFLPLLIGLLLLHAHLTFPTVDITRTTVTTETDDKKTRLNRYTDSTADSKSALKDGESERPKLEKKKKKHSFGSAPNTAQGFFAVTREFTPGGINGKPPEKIISVASTASSSTNSFDDSASINGGFGNNGVGLNGNGNGGNGVREQKTAAGKAAALGQSIYKNIFKGGQKEEEQETIRNGGRGKRGKNVFYVVLRLGHLIFFDDESQTDVRYVLPLSSYIPSIYSDDSPIPEGELFIRRNAICLRHKLDIIASNNGPTSPLPPQSPNPDAPDTKPYFFFSESCSNKEDFYFSLLAAVSPPPVVPLKLETPDLISLMQRLHLSESHMETRWLNALLGRMFLSINKTPRFEQVLRTKIAKKMSRVNKPGFLSKIELRNVDCGGQLPYILRPKMRELGIEGGVCVEGDIEYKGGFTFEISTIATLSLGSHIRPREFPLLLSITLKRLSGHLLLRIKPPPSNRLWFTFEHPPKIDLEVKPVVSTRQITYGVVLRAIESRIKEVVMETLVGEMWDDVPFWSSEGGVRGGIWDENLPQDDEGADAEARLEDERMASAPVMGEKGEKTPLGPQRSTESLPAGVGLGVGMGWEGQGSYSSGREGGSLGTAAMGGRREGFRGTEEDEWRRNGTW